MTPRILKDPPAPGTAAWRSAITASKVPVILGLSPWKTASELWMEMAQLTEPESLSGDHLDWGHYAEESLVKWWLHKHEGWQAGAGEVAYTDDDLPFPNLVTLDRRARRGRRFHIIECKTSNSQRTWGDAGDDLPGIVHAQVLFQMGVSGIHEASVVAQIGSTVPRIYTVEWDQDLFKSMVVACADFHASLGVSEPPVPSVELLDQLRQARTTPPAEGEVEADETLVSEWIDAHRRKIEVDMDISRLEDKLKAGDPTKITWMGKTVATRKKGRLALTRLPAEVKHLAKDPDVCELKPSAKLFAEKYPDVADACTGPDSYTFTPKPFI